MAHFDVSAVHEHARGACKSSFHLRSDRMPCHWRERQSRPTCGNLPCGATVADLRPPAAHAQRVALGLRLPSLVSIRLGRLCIAATKNAATAPACWGTASRAACGACGHGACCRSAAGCVRCGDAATASAISQGDCRRDTPRSLPAPRAMLLLEPQLALSKLGRQGVLHLRPFFGSMLLSQPPRTACFVSFVTYLDALAAFCRVFVRCASQKRRRFGNSETGTRH